MLSGVDATVETDTSTLTITIPVNGMSCASCVAKIEKGMAAVPGVVRAKVNLATERATIRYRQDETDPIRLVGAIQDLGYESNVENVTIHIEGMSCASCVTKVEQVLGKTACVRP